MDSGLAELPGVTGNINGLTRALMELTGLPPEHCLPLVDQTDDREVCRQVRRAADEAEDLLLVYFAGHGLIGQDGRELYLALPHSNPADPLFNAVRFAELRQLITRSPARNRVLILDCCYSGRAIPDTMSGAAEDIAFAQTEVSGTYTLTATSATMTALAPVGERRTLFTGALLDLLDSGVAEGERLLTLGSMYAQLRRTLTPQPRQQGSDTAAELALAVNAAHRSAVHDDGIDSTVASPAGAASAVPGSAPEAVLLTASPGLAGARRLLSVLRWLLVACVVAVTHAAVVGGGFPFSDPQFLSVDASSLLLALLWVVLVPRLPRRYGLLVDEQGLTLTANQDVHRLAWQDVQRVSTVRSSPGRLLPSQVAIWPRRGFVPPRRQRFGPRTDHKQGFVRFCRLAWLNASADDVAAVIARHAPGLWDDAHGLRSELPAAHFGKKRAVRTAGVFWAAVFTVPGSVGLFGLLADDLITKAVGLCWLVFWTLPGLYVLTFSFLPVRLRIDQQGIGVRANLSRLDATWPEIEDVTVRPGKHGPELRIRTAQRPVATWPFTGKLALPYDPRTRTVTLVLAAFAMLPAELDAALARFAGHGWVGRQDEEDASGGVFGEDYTLVGRLAGPRCKSIWVVGISAATALPVYLEQVVSPGASLLLALVAAALAMVAGATAAERCELCIDAQGLELRSGAFNSRVPWAAISRAAVTQRAHFALTGPAPALMVWFKDGARVPGKWRWRQCFVPHSGGVAVVELRSFDGVRADQRHLAVALSHFAGPERTAPAAAER
ncbi:caspase family protein [Streptomyces sp. NPDC001093]|uniref:caspase family protein n=1 Tax=Streptomyces sp. NPDC001093 TaxID=3154376 RepID=UPI003323E4F6